jgi:preprotein translocase subunit SecD
VKALLPLVALLVAPALVSCGSDEAGDAPPESDTAMTVEDGVQLEFRMVESSLGSTEADCEARYPDTGGESVTPDTDPAEPLDVCARADGVLSEVQLSPAIVTAEHVDYLDYDYGTAGLPVVYVVFDEEGVEAWNAAVAAATEEDGWPGLVHIMVDGRSVEVTDSSLSPNDVHQIQGIATIEEAEATVRLMATGSR